MTDGEDPRIPGSAPAHDGARGPIEPPEDFGNFADQDETDSMGANAEALAALASAHEGEVMPGVITPERAQQLDSSAQGRRQHYVLEICMENRTTVQAKIAEMAGVTTRALQMWMADDEAFRQDWNDIRRPPAATLAEDSIALAYKAEDYKMLGEWAGKIAPEVYGPAAQAIALKRASEADTMELMRHSQEFQQMLATSVPTSADLGDEVEDIEELASS